MPIKCNNCQNDNAEEAKFCVECGTELVYQCPSCGKENPPTHKFCYECGQRLDEEIRKTESIDLEKPERNIPKNLADKILEARSIVEGERKLVTVLFADVKGSTSIGELLDPEELRNIIEKSYQISLQEIHKFEGTVNQFLGDGYMALFGAPISHEDHAIRAIHSALSIQKAMTGYGENLKKERGIDFNMRMGINTGTVVVGSIGDDLKMDYTALGDTVNLASRMEQIAKPGNITVAESTYKTAKDHFNFKPLGDLKIKGKKNAVSVYEVIGTSEKEKTRIEISEERGFTKFIGRDREIEILRDSLIKSKEGLGQVVTIIGDAGIGKSRLLYEFGKLLEDENILYLEGRCISYGKSISYLPVVDIIKKRFRIDKLDTEKTIKKKIEKGIANIDKNLEGGIPFLYDILSIETNNPLLKNLDVRDKRKKTLEAIKNLVLADSKKIPLVYVVENLHWIDGASQEFINFLIDNIPNSKIMLILTSRPGYSVRWGEKSYHIQIAPSRLKNNEVEEMIRFILRKKKITKELIKLITDKADGIPFYVEEIVKSFTEGEIIVREEDGYSVSKDIAKVDVPNSIQDIITARIDRLEESHKRTLQYASVIGRGFSYKLLKELMETGDELQDNLAKLKSLELIYERSLFPDLEYRFKHSLTQEVAYNSLLMKRRKELHGIVGEIIEDLYGDKLEENYELLAHHYKNSDNMEQALNYLILAGEKASGLYSHIEAKSYYEEALDFLRNLAKNKQNRIRTIDVILKLADELMFYETVKTCLKLLGEAEKLAKKLRDDARLAKIYYLMGMTIYYSLEHPDIGIKFANRCLDIAKNIDDEKLIASAYYVLSSLYFKKGEFPRTIELVLDSVTLNERFGNVQVVIHSLGIMGVSHSWIGNIDKGRDYIRKGINMAEELGDVRRIAAGYYYLGVTGVMYGHLKEAIENLQKSISLFKDSGDIFYMLLPTGFLGYGYARSGDMKKGIEILEKNLIDIKEMKGPTLWFEALFNALLGESYLMDGKISRALTHTTKSLNLASKHGNKFEEAHAYQILGMIYTQKGESFWKKGELSLTKSIEIIKEAGADGRLPYSYMALGLLHKSRGQVDKAKEFLEKALPLFENLKDEENISRVNKELSELKQNFVEEAT